MTTTADPSRYSVFCFCAVEVITTEQTAKREIVTGALVSPFQTIVAEQGPMTLNLHSPIPELRAQAERARRLSRCSLAPDDARTMENYAIELERKANELEFLDVADQRPAAH